MNITKKFIPIFCLSLTMSLSIFAKGKPGGGGGNSGGGDSVPAPTSFSAQASSTSASSIDLSWSSSGGSTTGFKLAFKTRKSPRNCNDGTVISLGDQESHVVSGLSANTEYFFALCAQDSSGSLSSKVTSSASTQTPSSPVELTSPAANEIYRAAGEIEDPESTLIEMDSSLSRTIVASGIGGQGYMLSARDSSSGQLDASFSGGKFYSDPGADLWADARGLAVDSQSNVYVCSRMCLVPDCQNSFSAGTVVDKYDSFGNRIWRNTSYHYSDFGTCSEILVYKDSLGAESLYLIASGQSSSTFLAKLDLGGNEIWKTSVSGSIDGNHRDYSNAAVLDSGVVFSLKDSNGDGIIQKFDHSGSAVASVSGVSPGSFSNSRFPLTAGIVNGQERIFVSRRGASSIQVFDANLNSVSDSCSSIDLATSSNKNTFGTFNVSYSSNSGQQFLYFVGFGSPTSSLYDGQGQILQFEILGDGSCDSQNEAGEAFDSASHTYNLSPIGQSSLFYSMTQDSAGDVYVIGLGSIMEYSGYRSYVLKFSAQ